MKKRFKTSILAIALLASVTGAFASDISNALSGKKTTFYMWQKYLRNGTPDGPPTIGTAANPYPAICSGVLQTCAVGTPIGGGTQITFRYPSL